MKSVFDDFMKDDTGATAIEYALLASLIAIAIVAGAASLGSKLGASLNNSANAVK